MERSKGRIRTDKEGVLLGSNCDGAAFGSLEVLVSK